MGLAADDRGTASAFPDDDGAIGDAGAFEEGLGVSVFGDCLGETAGETGALVVAGWAVIVALSAPFKEGVKVTPATIASTDRASPYASPYLAAANASLALSR